jgi:hypothetical protein
VDPALSMAPNGILSVPFGKFVAFAQSESTLVQPLRTCVIGVATMWRA